MKDCDAYFYAVSSLGTIHLPPSVFISQYTFKGFPLPSGSIQYSPSPSESFDSRICLPGVRLTAEILDYRFTRAVSGSGHVERTSLLFAAMNE